MRYTWFILIILFFSVAIMSCQKDQGVDLTQTKLVAKSNTADTSGNFLAVKGTLKINIGDSTYTFDATKDSIAFINVHIDSNKYFGITAINKEHTMSFGISSSGSVITDLNTPIAGSQLLFSADNNKTSQYTLVNSIPETPNKINLSKYMQDSVLTKGTFSTIMAKDGKANSTAYKVQGSFDLKLK